MSSLAPYFSGGPAGPDPIFGIDSPVTASALVGGEPEADPVVEQPLRLATSRPFDNLVGVMNAGGGPGLNDPNNNNNMNMMQPRNNMNMMGHGGMMAPNYYAPGG